MSPKTTERSRRKLRQDLIESAANLLSDAGMEGFSLNRVAEGAGTSKQMIYTIFGGKSYLIKAVYDHAVSEFVEVLESIREDDPVERLFRYLLEYRDFVLDNRALFDVMYGLSFAKEFQDQDEQVIERNEIFSSFDRAIKDCVDEGHLDSTVDVRSLTDSLWASANGCIRLELVGYYPEDKMAKQHFTDTTRGVLWGCGTVLPNMDGSEE